MASTYAEVLVEVTGCTTEEAPLVEGYLRLDYGSLSNLSREQIRRDAREILPLVRAEPAASRRLAVSFGLVAEV